MICGSVVGVGVGEEFGVGDAGGVDVGVGVPGDAVATTSGGIAGMVEGLGLMVGVGVGERVGLGVGFAVGVGVGCIVGVGVGMRRRCYWCFF